MNSTRHALLGCAVVLVTCNLENVPTDSGCDAFGVADDMRAPSNDLALNTTDSANDCGSHALMDAAVDTSTFDAGVSDRVADVVLHGIRRCEPRPLPSPGLFSDSPRLIGPHSTRRVTSQRPTFRWEMRPGLVRPRVQICADVECLTVRTTIAVTGEIAARMQVRPSMPLTPGVNFWRVVADQTDGSSEKVSYTWEFWVGRRDSPLDTSIGTISDLNGDGIDDVALSTNGPVNYRVEIYHGRTGGLTEQPAEHVEAPPWAQLYFGADLFITDLDLNGRADLIIDEGQGSPGRHSAVHFVVGSTRCILEGDSSLEWDYGIASVGDVNGDGFPDFVKFGSRLALLQGTVGGFISTRWDRSSSCTTCRFNSIVGIGDINGDGYEDVAISSDDAHVEHSDIVEVYLGAVDGLSASAALEVSPPTKHIRFGTDMAAMGDLDGDGMGDFLISDASRVTFYRGANPLSTLLPVSSIVPTEPQGSTPIGSYLVSPSDMNGDGTMEVVMFSPTAPWDGENGPGRIYLYELEDMHFRLIDRIGPAVGLLGPFGLTASIQGDVNADGFMELLVLSAGAAGGYLYEFDGTPRVNEFSVSRYFSSTGLLGLGFGPK